MPSNVIRREAAPNPTIFRFQDVEAEAAEILARARADADRVAAAASERLAAEREAQRRSAYDEGYEAGRATGHATALEEGRAAARQAATAEFERLTAALGAALAEYERRRHTLHAEAEEGMLRLAVAVAARVCKFAAAQSSDAARANVRSLLEMVRQQDDLEFHLHPDEAGLLREELPQLARQLAAAEHVRVVADPGVARGGCVLRTSDGSIDATIDTQLAQVAESLLGGTRDAVLAEPV